MRTNIDIDDDLMAAALRAGPYKTKKEAVEAGLKLVARQAAYREILKWRGKLKWEGDEFAVGDRYAQTEPQAAIQAGEPPPRTAARQAVKPKARPPRDRR